MKTYDSIYDMIVKYKLYTPKGDMQSIETEIQ